MSTQTMNAQIMQQRYNNVQYLWDRIRNAPIIQTAIQQNFDSCALAAICTHIVYNMKISYARNAIGPVLMPIGILADHIEWENEMRQLVGQRVQNISVLLEDAKRNGVPLQNGLKLKIDSSYQIYPLSEDSLRIELRKYTVLAVMLIHHDYSPHGETPYMGRKQLITKNNGSPEAHAVVIVGEYEDDTLFMANEPKEALWIYQNSDGDKDRSFLGNGLNVVRNSLIMEAYCVEIYEANPFLTQGWAQTLKARGIRVEPRVVPEILAHNPHP